MDVSAVVVEAETWRARGEHKRTAYVVENGDSHDEELKCAICHEPTLSPVLLPCACELMVCKHACLLRGGEEGVVGGKCPSCGAEWSVAQLREPPRLVLNMLARVRVTCLFCSLSLARGVHGELFEQHYSEACPVRCPLECGLVFTRRSGLAHLAACPNKKASCAAASFGCSFQGALREVKEHESQCRLSEISAFLVPLMDENKRLSAVVALLSERLTLLERRFPMAGAGNEAELARANLIGAPILPSQESPKPRRDSAASPAPASPIVPASPSGFRWADSPSPSETVSPVANHRKQLSLSGASKLAAGSVASNTVKLNGSASGLNLSVQGGVSASPGTSVNSSGSRGEFFSSVFVGNINFSASKKEIFERFSEFGTVDSVKLLKDEYGESTGKAYVNFVHAADAQSALAMDQSKFLGRTLYVKPGPLRKV